MPAKSFISFRIKELRVNKLGITAEKLSAMLNPPRSSKTICSWERGRTQPDANSLAQLCKIFGVSVSSMFPPLGIPISEGEDDYPYAEMALYGSISAGEPLAIIPVEGTHPIPIQMHRRYPKGFLLKVEGESMNRVLPNGSYALVDPEQSDIQNNKAYALCVNGGDATVKRVKQLANGYELIPDSNDPTFQPSIYNYAEEESFELVIIGQVVWMMLPFDWEI